MKNLLTILLLLAFYLCKANAVNITDCTDEPLEVVTIESYEDYHFSFSEACLFKKENYESMSLQSNVIQSQIGVYLDLELQNIEVQHVSSVNESISSTQSVLEIRLAPDLTEKEVSDHLKAIGDEWRDTPSAESGTYLYLVKPSDRSTLLVPTENTDHYVLCYKVRCTVYGFLPEKKVYFLLRTFNISDARNIQWQAIIESVISLIVDITKG